MEYEITRAYRRVLVDLLDMETGVRGFQVSGKSEFLSPFNSAKARLGDDIMDAKQKASQINGELEDIKKWETEIYEYVEVLYNEVNIKTSNPEAIPPLAEIRRQKMLMDSLRNQIGTRINIKANSIQDNIILNKQSQNNFIAILFASNSLILLFSIGAFIFSLRYESKLRIAEEKARRNEELYHFVLDANNDGILEYDLIKQKIYVNDPKLKALGYKLNPDGNEISYLKQFIHPDDLKEAEDKFQKMLEGKINTYAMEYRYINPKGSYFWVLTRRIGIFDETGKLIKVYGVQIDINEQKKREAELERLNSELETFTYVTSHDLRAPLVNLKGFSRELEISINNLREITSNSKVLPNELKEKIEYLTNTEMGESLGYIINSVDRMDILTKTLLDLARIGKYELKYSHINTNELVEKIILSHNFEIKEKNIKISLKPLPDIICDAVAIGQIFNNLIDNAIKYQNREIGAKIEIGYKETISDYIFSIADTGRGIEDGDKEKVFEIFRRARNVGEVRGQGIGMSFVLATIKRLGGDIWFESEIDVGTCFYFKIPKINNI